MRLGRHLRWNLGRRLRLHLDLSFDMVNRPYFNLYRDREIISVGLAWGNRLSDPVWSLELEVWRREAP